MEKMKIALEVCVRAFKTLEAILNEPVSIIVRDASLQRFEYTFEACWKLVKAFLFAAEGIDCGSPKGCFRAAGKSGLLSIGDTEMALCMCDDRNLLSHTYIEAVAETIFKRLPGYKELIGRIVTGIRHKLKADNHVGT